ncbi:MAG: hypothetical protein V3T18_09380 [Pseudomonadales bacterium]
MASSKNSSELGFEALVRQAVRATTNLVDYLTGGSDYIQANETKAS